MTNKLPWDAECSASRGGMERFFRALVCTRGHFTDSFTLSNIEKPSRGVTVFCRIWLSPGMEQQFMALANVDELRPPPRVYPAMDDMDSRVAVEEQRRTIKRI